VFFSLYVCTGCDYTAADYLGGTVTFNPEANGLLAWGSTKTGGMWQDHYLYDRMAAGECVGAGFRHWFNQVKDLSIAPEWWYGMVLIGDASLATARPVHNVTDDQWYPDIQSAIDEANEGDEIVLMPGTYAGDGNRDLDFIGKAITVRGTDPNDPAVVAATVIDCQGTEAEPHRGFRFHSGETADSVVAGLTITNGYGNEENVGAEMKPVGGAVFCTGSSPTLVNCAFSGNSAAYDGGGMYNYDSSPTLANCTFANNVVGYGGGGMYNWHDSNPTLTGCTFSGNSAAGWGGGIHNETNCDPILVNCTFSGNTADYGGGMCNWYDNTNPTLTNCTFSGNSADYGGGMCNGFGNTSPTLTNCTFSGNSADYGGGMCNCYDNTSPTLTNCTFSGNSAGSYGGGVYNYDGQTTLTNCTFSGNSAGSNGGGLYTEQNEYGSPTVTNCILWGNTPEEVFNYAGTPAITYNDIRDGWPDAGNINDNPLFVDPDGPDDTPGTEDDNLRLLTGSPCIDAANNNARGLAGITTDLDGRPRFMDNPDTPDCQQAPGTCGDLPIVDMGAYEYFPTAKADFDVDGDVDSDDLAAFKACATGPAIPYNPAALPEPEPGCTLAPDANGHIAADFDEDNDVDQSDFGSFQRCYSGEGNLADPHCAD